MRHAVAMSESDTHPWASNEVRRQHPKRQAASDAFADIRCPACHHPLTKRLTSAGPAFVCGCNGG
jgi:hypothetical protein